MEVSEVELFGIRGDYPPSSDEGIAMLYLARLVAAGLLAAGGTTGCLAMTLAPPSQLDVHGAEEAIPLPPSEELIGTTPAEAEPDTNKGNNSFTPAALTGGTTVSLVELRAGMQRTVMVIGWEMRAPLEICLSKVSEFRKMFHGRYVCQIEPGEAIELPQAPAAPAAAGPKLCDDPPGFHVFHTDCM